MSQPLSEYAEKLLARHYLVMELPNEQVSGVVSELILFIAHTSALVHVLKAQFDPMAHHTSPELVGRGADIVRNKVLFNAVCTVETGGDPLSCLPKTPSGQRYILDRVIDWIIDTKNVLQEKREE